MRIAAVWIFCFLPAAYAQGPPGEGSTGRPRTPPGEQGAEISENAATLEAPHTEPTVLRGHEERILALAFSPDTRWLATGGVDRTVRLWDITNSQAEPIVLRGHADKIYGLVFSPDGRSLASGSRDGTVRLWSIANPSTDQIVVHEDGEPGDLVFSADGRWVAIGSETGRLRLRDLENVRAQPTDLLRLEAVRSIRPRSPSDAPLRPMFSTIFPLVFSPDGRWLASGSDDRAVRLWDVTRPKAEPAVLRGHERSIQALAFSLEGRWLASGSRDHTVRLWDVTNRVSRPAVLRHHPRPDWDRGPLENAAIVLALAFSPDGRWLASGAVDGTVRLWQVASPHAEPIVLDGHEGGVRVLAFSPDGRWLASASGDHTARLWDVTNPRATPIVLRGHEAELRALIFSPDGRWLATAGADRTVRLWPREAGKPIRLAGPPRPLPSETSVVEPPRVELAQWPLRVGGGVKRAVRIFQPAPQYTKAARKARIVGVVVVELIIDENGDVTAVRVLKGLDLGLDQSVVDTVRRWKFKPATLHGQPVAVIQLYTVHFQFQ